MAGVLLLDWVIAAIGRGDPVGLPQVKFPGVVVPGDMLELRWTSAGTRVNFRCTRAGEAVAEGVIDFGDVG